MPDFELSKWYADCTTDQGDAVIIYSAELRWRRHAIHYTNLLMYCSGRPMRSRFSLSEHPTPQAQGGSIVLCQAIYSADHRWRGNAIHYTNLLMDCSGRPMRSRFSLREQPPPQAQGGSIGWRSRAWNVEGCWLEPGGAIRETLFDSPAGTLEWNCVAPRSAAHLRIGEDEHFRGWGD